MSDIDFDELDQAVNALMKDEGESTSSDQQSVAVNSPSASAQPATLQLPSAPEIQSIPNPEVADTQEVPLPAAVASPVAQPLSVKRRGRFMDVMHPKSDMTNQLPPRHQATFVRPVAVAETPRAETTTDDATTPAPQDVMPEEAESSQGYETPLYPDPIDLQDNAVPSTDEPVLQSVETSADAPEQTNDEKDDEELAAILELEPEAPQSSPFLADAKVEKRPLGAPTQSEGDSTEPVALEEGLSFDEPEAQVAPVPVVSLPPELQPEVAKLDAEVVEASAPAEPLVEEKSLVKAETIVPAGGSISQQYTEQPSSVDQANGSIYDTDSYHQPLQHPEKKKSSAVVIVWILVLALAGAIGAAGYFYMTMR